MINVTGDYTQTDQIVMIERNALDQWGHGDPSGFRQLYFVGGPRQAPSTATR